VSGEASKCPMHGRTFASVRWVSGPGSGASRSESQLRTQMFGHMALLLAGMAALVVAVQLVVVAHFNIPTALIILRESWHGERGHRGAGNRTTSRCRDLSPDVLGVDACHAT
jgi:hypothetical protein